MVSIKLTPVGVITTLAEQAGTQGLKQSAFLPGPSTSQIVVLGTHVPWAMNS